MEGDHRFLRFGDVIAEALEREEEAGVGPERVDQLARRTWQREPTLRERLPGEEVTRVFLAGGCPVGKTDDIASTDAMPLLNVRDERDQRGICSSGNGR